MNDSFLKAYIEAALWSSMDDQDRPLDGLGLELAPGTLAVMKADCTAFLEANKAALESVESVEGSIRGVDIWEAAGHDFWLTRNHHGAGFWDGDWPEPQASTLTEAAHAFGEFDLYVGDNGEIDHG